MKLTIRILMDTKEKHNLTNEEFISMVRGSDYNPFTDEEAIRLIFCAVATNVIWNVIASILMDYKPNKKKPIKKRHPTNKGK